MPPGKFCEITPKNRQITSKNTHLPLKIRILFVHFLFLGSEGGPWHSGPLRRLVAMTHKIREVDVEKYVYYANKLRQNVGLEIWLWREILTSQTAHTIQKWRPYVTEWTPPMKIFCVHHWQQLLRSKISLNFARHCVDNRNVITFKHALLFI